MIATDLDGTLLGADHALSARTRDALRGCARTGIAVVFVTARPPRTVARLAADTGVEITAICSNGALVVDYATGKTTVVHEFAHTDARRLVDQLRTVLPDAGYALESGDTVWYDSLFRVGIVSGDAGRLTDPWEGAWALADRIVKVLARSPGLDADWMLAAALSAVDVECEISHSGGAGLLEIAPRGSTKATTLAWLCAERGIGAADVVAFGDMPNDLPMLHWAGTAYAVANAHPGVLAAADHTTAANTQDGVAMVLEHLLENAP
jgi:hypothetical protein